MQCFFSVSRYECRKDEDTRIRLHLCRTGNEGITNTTFTNTKFDMAKVFDSIFIYFQNKGGVFHDEFVVYNPKQALAKYIINFERITHLETVQLAFRSLSADYCEREMLRSRDFTSSEDEVYFRVAEAQFLRLIHPHNAQVYFINTWRYSFTNFSFRFRKSP